MKRLAIMMRAAALAFGAFLTLHQPAHAGPGLILETATSGTATWAYTVGATALTYDFGPVQDADNPAPIQNTDWLHGSDGAASLPDVTPIDTVQAPAGQNASVPEPGTLALLGFPLICVGAIGRRRR